MNPDRLGVIRLSWILIISVLNVQPLLPQTGSVYRLAGEDGNIEISETGEISWVIGKGLSADRYRLDLELDQYPKIDRIHKYGWIGAARRFLISAYKVGSRGNKSTLLLVDFHRDPARVKILDRYEPSFEVRDFAYYYPERALYLLDSGLPVITRVEMAADAQRFPAAEEWAEIIDRSKLPGAWRNEPYRLSIPAEGELAGLRVSTGIYDCFGGAPTVSRLVKRDGLWRAVPLREAGEGALRVPSPQEGAEPEKTRLSSSAVLRQARVLDRRGRVFEPDSIRIGESRPNGQARLGREEFLVQVPVTAAGEDWWQRAAEVWVYWVVTPENAPRLEKRIGNHVIIEPMSAVGGDRLKFNQGRLQEPVIALPLTDARMANGGVLSMQVLVRSEEQMALSDVFATTLLPSWEGVEVEWVEVGEMTAGAKESWELAKRKLKNR